MARCVRKVVRQAQEWSGQRLNCELGNAPHGEGRHYVMRIATLDRRMNEIRELTAQLGCFRLLAW